MLRLSQDTEVFYYLPNPDGSPKTSIVRYTPLGTPVSSLRSTTVRKRGVKAGVDDLFISQKQFCLLSAETP